MAMLVGALIAAGILYWLIDSIFHLGPVVFLVTLSFSLLLLLPFAIIKGFVRGNIDYAQDRADARMRERAKRQKRVRNTFVDARSVSYDNRSITIHRGILMARRNESAPQVMVTKGLAMSLDDPNE